MNIYRNGIFLASFHHQITTDIAVKTENTISFADKTDFHAKLVRIDELNNDILLRDLVNLRSLTSIALSKPHIFLELSSIMPMKFRNNRFDYNDEEQWALMDRLIYTRERLHDRKEK